MFKEITEQELADMFNISLEQFKKEANVGNIKCIAKDEDAVYIIPVQDDKPLKIVHDDNWIMELDGYNAKFSRKLSSNEVTKLLIDMFGTTDIAAIDKDKYTEDEWIIIEEVLKNGM